jgi:hypothetical protein
MEQLDRAERYLAKIRAVYAGAFAQSHDRRSYEDDLVSFFMHCYHVKDWIVRLNKLEVTSREVDIFINSNPCLQVCADLCNGSKHCELDRPARSGTQPHFTGKSYEASTWFTGSGGGEVLRAKYTILTSSGFRDALQLAEECMACWRQFVSDLEVKYRELSHRGDANPSSSRPQHQVMKQALAAGQKLSFEAELENWAEGMDYCAVPVPAEITKTLGTTGPVLVMARVNGSQPFQVSLFPVGGGQHYIRIKAKVRHETNTNTGDLIRVRMTVLDRASVTIPEDLLTALQAEAVVEAFKSLPPGKQNFMIRRVDEAARPQTREKRIQDVVAAAHQQREKLADGT